LNKWSEVFGISFPDCKMCAQCCRCASPSSPSIELLKRAASDTKFAKDFFSIFIPYLNIEEAEKINSIIVKKTVKAAENPENKVSANELVFYHCRYISEDNKCLIHEDRPALCRNYPDSPFLVFPPDCAYEEWSKNCKEKYNQLQEELKKIQHYKKEIESLKYQRNIARLMWHINRVNNRNYNLMLMLPALSLVSPGKSWIKIL